MQLFWGQYSPVQRFYRQFLQFIILYEKHTSVKENAVFFHEIFKYLSNKETL